MRDETLRDVRGRCGPTLADFQERLGGSWEIVICGKSMDVKWGTPLSLDGFEMDDGLGVPL